ncbi:MAG: site-2 protease family protein [Chloroflexi bacterium]|nr:site-2 protease family protein [Chloroflexota bacterium]
MGRLTLNPLVHLDPLGTLMLLIARFGWGKPAPVNPYNLRNGPRAGMAMVAAAGPLSNLFAAALLAVPLRLELVPFAAGSRILPSLYELLSVAILINVILAVFNLLPIAPLDGFRVLVWFLPSRYSAALGQLEYYGPVILLFLISLGFFGFNFLGLILGEPVRLLLTLILG